MPGFIWAFFNFTNDFFSRAWLDLIMPIFLFTVTGEMLGNAINVAIAPVTIFGLVTLITTWLLYIAGVLAFIFLVISGIVYITAGGDPERARKAQLGLINAIIGIIIISLSYVILRAVGWIVPTGI